MERRIFGLENEYGVTCTLRGQRRLSPDEVARYLFRRVVSWGRSSNVFLANGARLYLDVGSHPEYATPGVRLDPRPRRARQGGGADPRAARWSPPSSASREEGIRGDIYLFKNNTDSAGNSYGCHENYLTSRRDDFAPLHRGAHPVPRQPPDLRRRGQGAADRPGRDVLHRPAGRAHLGGRVVAPPPGRRPIINTRDEPHADAERYRRLHVIVGDSNMSEYATFLKVGRHARSCCACSRTRSVVLRDMTLENPIRAIREISHDITCTRRVRLANGREASALEIQAEYLNRALRYAEHPRPVARTRSRRSRCGSTCMTDLEKDPLSLDREVDWVIKYNLIEAYREQPRPAAQPPPGGAARPAVPRRQPRPVGSSTSCSDAGHGRADRAPTPRSTRPSRRRRRPPGPACGASSSGGPRSASATTRSTGCT